MKLLVVWFALAIAAFAALVADDGDDDNCSQAWITVDADSSSTATAAMATEDLSRKAEALPASSTVIVSPSTDSSGASTTASSSSATNPASATAASSMAIPSGSSGGISTPTLPDGTPGFPINDDHLKAPVDDTPVPDGAAIYTPQSNTINCTEFTTWNLAQPKNNLPSQFLKVTPGIYFHSLVDSSTSTTIAFRFYQRAWTLDLRGVTFILTCNPANRAHRDSTILTINQSEDFTLLGGTF